MLNSLRSTTGFKASQRKENEILSEEINKVSHCMLILHKIELSIIHLLLAIFSLFMAQGHGVIIPDSRLSQTANVLGQTPSSNQIKVPTFYSLEFTNESSLSFWPVFSNFKCTNGFRAPCLSQKTTDALCVHMKHKQKQQPRPRQASASAAAAAAVTTGLTLSDS